MVPISELDKLFLQNELATKESWLAYAEKHNLPEDLLIRTEEGFTMNFNEFNDGILDYVYVSEHTRESKKEDNLTRFDGETRENSVLIYTRTSDRDSYNDLQLQQPRDVTVLPWIVSDGKVQYSFNPDNHLWESTDMYMFTYLDNAIANKLGLDTTKYNIRVLNRLKELHALNGLIDNNLGDRVLNNRVFFADGKDWKGDDVTREDLCTRLLPFDISNLRDKSLEELEEAEGVKAFKKYLGYAVDEEFIIGFFTIIGATICRQLDDINQMILLYGDAKCGKGQVMSYIGAICGESKFLPVTQYQKDFNYSESSTSYGKNFKTIGLNQYDEVNYSVITDRNGQDRLKSYLTEGTFAYRVSRGNPETKDASNSLLMLTTDKELYFEQENADGLNSRVCMIPFRRAFSDFDTKEKKDGILREINSLYKEIQEPERMAEVAMYSIKHWQQLQPTITDKREVVHGKEIIRGLDNNTLFVLDAFTIKKAKSIGRFLFHYNRVAGFDPMGGDGLGKLSRLYSLLMDDEDAVYIKDVTMHKKIREGLDVIYRGSGIKTPTRGKNNFTNDNGKRMSLYECNEEQARHFMRFKKEIYLSSKED